jgi:signal transduction histidine kinase
MMRERELHNIRQDYQHLQNWMDRVQQITAVLSGLDSADEAFAPLLDALIAESSYEFAAILDPINCYETGIELSADGTKKLRYFADLVYQDADVKVVTSDELELPTLNWLMLGPVCKPNVLNQVEFVIAVGRSERTVGYFPPPWTREIRLFQHLLSSVGHVHQALVTRSELFAERNMLKFRVDDATTQLQEALAIANQTRDEAERANQAKSEFLAMFSHELKTPLNTILAYQDLLVEECQELRHINYLPDLYRLGQCAHQLLSMINDILDLSRAESKRLEMYGESFDVVAEIKAITELHSPLIHQNNNHLNLDLPNEPILIWSDLVKFKQIIRNLLSNASKFTSDGSITIRAALSGSSASEPKDELQHWVRIEVHDTGIGMSEEQCAKIFQPFMQADTSISRKFGGTGLGLAICKQFCEYLGGNIAVQSVLEKGCSFVVTLPCHPLSVT